MKNNFKGMVNIEFILSVVVFLSTITFITVTTIYNVPNLHTQTINEKIKTDIFSISEMLINDKGFPENWNSENVKAIGLSTGEPYVIDMTKVKNLNDICEKDYQKFVSILGMENYQVIINITQEDGSNILFCQPPKISQIRPIFGITRTAVLNGYMATVEVNVD